MSERINEFGSQRLTIPITQERIDESIRRSSAHCMLSEAIRDKYPQLRNVLSDLATIRYTDPKRQLRFIHLTPRNAQLALIDFDAGAKIEPFTIVLEKQAVQVIPIVTRPRAMATEPETVIADLEQKSIEAAETAKTKTAIASQLAANGQRSKAAKDRLDAAKQEAIQASSKANTLADQLVAAKTPKKKRNKARLVAGAGGSKREIPTIVGGSSPPIGNLARVRAYGLRTMTR